MRPTLSVSLPSFGTWADGDWSRLVALGREADEAGVDRIVVPDHVAIGPGAVDYPWGRFPRPLDAPWLEPLTVLTALAGATERVRLSTGILVVPLRPAIVLAKTVATLDVLSGGRVDLGVGTGWLRDELEGAGLDHDRRGQLLTDGIAACRALWAGPHASVDLPTVSFSDLTCSPTPAQDRLPVLFSGTLHRRNVRRIVELGDGWIPIMGATLEDLRTGVDVLRAAMEGAGRDPDVLQVRVPLPVVRADDGSVDLEATMAAVPTLLAVGATEVRADVRWAAPDLEGTAEGLARLVALFRSHLP